MLFRFGSLTGLPMEAMDGEVGRIKDAFFDDHRWTMRYLVVNGGTWLAGRNVLISPIALRKIDWQRNVVQVAVVKQQIVESPDVDTDKPVSRQHETDFLNHYGYPHYWTGRGTDPHLRSTKEMTGYRLQTSNDSMVEVEDFLFDTVTWAIRYLVVDMQNWLPGKHVVIPPRWITSVNWNAGIVTVNVTRRILEAAPDYESSIEFSRAHEANLQRHYHWHGDRQ